MTDTVTPDEQPKEKIARRVVAQKRQYFVPAHGVSVKAEDAEDAVKLAKKSKKGAVSAEEEGDG